MLNKLVKYNFRIFKKLIFLICLIFQILPLPTFAHQNYSTVTIKSLKAWVSDSKPKQNSKVTAYCEVKDQNNKPVKDATCTFIWKYKTTSHTMTAKTDKNGKGNVSRNIGRATKGYKVEVAVAVTKGTTNKTAKTYFTPK